MHQNVFVDLFIWMEMIQVQNKIFSVWQLALTNNLQLHCNHSNTFFFPEKVNRLLDTLFSPMNISLIVFWWRLLINIWR